MDCLYPMRDRYLANDQTNLSFSFTNGKHLGGNENVKSPISECLVMFDNHIE